jgi:hypothetical protein
MDDASNHSMFRMVCEAFWTAVRIASSTLVGLLPTISLSRYTWLLIGPPGWVGGHLREHGAGWEA